MNAGAEALSAKLKAMRLRYKENQTQFALRFGVSIGTYNRWERWGPPNMRAHRGYIELMLQRLGEEHGQAKTRAKDARAAAAADRQRA